MEPEVQVVVPQAVATTLATLGCSDGERYLPFHEFKLLQHSEVLRSALHREASTLRDLVELGAPGGDGTEEARVDLGVPEFHPQEEARFFVKISLNLKHFPEEVLAQRKLGKEANEICGHAAEDAIGDELFPRTIARKEKARPAKAEGAESELPCTSAEKGLSVPGQLRELRRYCSQHGYEIVKEFHDDGFSGTTDKRPGFQEMIAYAEEHPDEIDAVLVWSFSRFARNRVHAVVYKARLHRLGIKVISISEPLPDGPEADLLEAVVEAMDAHRSIRLARDVMRGIREAILQGFYPLSTVPIGYRREEVKVGGVRRFKLVPDEATAPLVRRIFEAYVKEGKGAKEIAQELNAQKLLTPRGRRWNRSAILRIISNPIYIGTLVVKFDSENARFLPAEQREIVAENFCTPLIPVEIFELAQRYREERARAHPQHLASDYLLSGLAYCAKCGAKLIGVPAKSGRYHYYACASYWNQGKNVCDGGLINQALLDKVVLDRVCEVLLYEENIRKLAEATNRALRTERARLEEEHELLSYQLRQCKQRLDRLLDLAEEGPQVPQALWQRIEERQQEVTELKARIAGLETRIDSLSSEEIELKEVVRFVSFLGHHLKDCPVRKQRAILRSFIKRIEVDKDRIRIEYTIPKPAGRSLDLEELDPVPILGAPGTPGRI